MSRRPARGFPRRPDSAFTLIELMVVIAIIVILMALLVPAFNSIKNAGALTRALSEVATLLEQARAEAMAARSYVYLGFANVTAAGQSTELHVGTVISLDGTSNTASANLRSIAKLLTIPNVRMTDFTGLPQNVQSIADASLQANSDYLVNFPSTSYFQGKYNDTALNNCPTLVISPEGDIVNSANPLVFFRTINSVGLVATRGTIASADGGIVSYSGGTGQLRIVRPK